MAPDEDDVLGDAQDDDGAAMLARVEALLQETEPGSSAVQGLSQRLLSSRPQPKGAEDDLLGRSIAIDCLEDDLARLSRKVKILDAGDREVIGFTAVATKPVRSGVVLGVATLEQIKELSTRTGRKYEDCKEALNKNNCDLETAAYSLAAEAAAAAEEAAAKRAAAESLQAAFDAATEGVKTLDGVSTEVQLRLYGLFKQATSGDAPMKSSAGMFDVKGQKKWAAWAAVRGQPAATAQASYVELVRTLRPPGSLPRGAAPSATCLSGSAVPSAPQPPPVAEAPNNTAADVAAAADGAVAAVAAVAAGTTAGDGVPSGTGLAAPEAVGMRLAREGALAELEGAILLNELAAVDETLGDDH
jgi:acyl-CoA-binding protein